MLIRKKKLVIMVENEKKNSFRAQLWYMVVTESSLDNLHNEQNLIYAYVDVLF